MYTGVVNETQEDGSIHGVQTQCIAIGDGVNYEKYPKNPVLTEADLPKGQQRESTSVIPRSGKAVTVFTTLLSEAGLLTALARF